MQTYVQSFVGVQNWELNIPGKFFTILNCTNPVSIQLFKSGRRLDLGTITAISAGIEIGGMAEGVEFDRVVVTTSASDTVTIGIGNGQARYNRGAANINVLQNRVAQIAPANTQKTVTNVTVQLVAANANRQYLLIQNKDPGGDIYINFGAGGATIANGLKIGAGGAYESDNAVATNAIQVIGSIASNANIVVVEG